MKCQKCGFDNKDGSKFCLKCGNRVDDKKTDTVKSEDEQCKTVFFSKKETSAPKSIKKTLIPLLASAAIISAAAMLSKSEIFLSDKEQIAVPVTETKSDETTQITNFLLSETSDETFDVPIHSTDSTAITDLSDMEKTDIYALYREFIFKKIKSGEYKENYGPDTSSGEADPFGFAFDLYDIDSDGIEELFISDGWIAGSCVWIYTVSDDQVVELTSYANHGGISLLGEKYLLFGSFSGQTGESSGSLYEKNGNSVDKVFSFFNDAYSDLRDTDIITRTINDAQVSESEFSSEISIYQNMSSVYLGRRYALQYYRIIDVFGGDPYNTETSQTNENYSLYSDSYFDETCRLYHNEQYYYDSVYPIAFEYSDIYEDGACFYDTDGQTMNIWFMENTNSYNSKDYLEYMRKNEPRISYSYYNDEYEYIGYTYYDDYTKKRISYGVAIVSPSSIVTMLLTINAVGDGECSELGNAIIQSMLDFARS